MMALSESDSTPTDALETFLDASDQIAALSEPELKATYVRVRLAREARGEFDHAEIVEWLADPCDDYLGTFARKLGLDVNPWTGTVVAELWDLLLTDGVSEETAVATVRSALEDWTRESVGGADAKVLNQMLDHYADG